MQFFTQLTFALLALLQLASAMRSTVTSTRTVKQIMTHTVIAEVPVYTPSPYTSSSSVPVYTSSSVPVYTSSIPVYTSSSSSTTTNTTTPATTYSPTASSSSSSSVYTTTPGTITYNPSGYTPKPTTVVPSYTAPSNPSATPSPPVNAAGRMQTGMSVMVAALVAGIFAMAL